MIVSELVPMQERGDEKLGREDKNAYVRSPDSMPFLTRKDRREKDHAICI